MGADLGFFAEDRERDFPELNKCPDCETFFADECCPLCGRVCPEEFRAGNRKPVKQKKHRRTSGNGRVQFVPWYHTPAIIIIALIFMPVLGIILAWTGPWKKHWKIIATVLVVLSYLLPTILGFVFSFTGMYEPATPPINLELSEADYRAACIAPDVEALYRTSNQYAGSFVRMECVVTEVSSTYFYDSEEVYMEANLYLCSVQQGERTFEFFVADCREEGQTRLAVSDTITVFGEVAGEIEGAATGGMMTPRPGVYARFIDVQ